MKTAECWVSKAASCPVVDRLVPVSDFRLKSPRNFQQQKKHSGPAEGTRVLRMDAKLWPLLWLCLLLEEKPRGPSGLWCGVHPGSCHTRAGPLCNTCGFNNIPLLLGFERHMVHSL